MNNWKRYMVEDVCDFIGGSQPPKSTFISYPKKGYTRLVQTRDFKTDKFPTYIPTNSTTKFFKKEDIIIGRYGPPIFQIFRGILEGAYNVALMKAVPKDKITNEFLYYFLTQKEVFEYVDKLSARTGGQTGVDLASLYKYPIHLPDKNQQKIITSVLSTLDSKIELNNRINAELEAMAKTIYDYWFVQFDFPHEFKTVKTDKNGRRTEFVEVKPYKSSGGKMVWNEKLKREIPEGWEVKELSKIARIGKDQLNPSMNPNKEYKHLSIPVFDTTGTYEVEKGKTIGSNKFIVEQNDILVSKLNPWFNRVFYPLGETDLICTTEMVVWKAPNENFKNYLYQLAKSTQFISYCVKSATGTSNSHKRVNPIVMMEFKQPFDKKVIDTYGSIIKSSLLKIISNKKENQKLTELRDWLLPMLMNGQVKVK